MTSIRTAAARVLADDASTPDERAIAGHVLGTDRPQPRSHAKGAETMPNQNIKPDDVPLDIARQVTDKADAARKDGVAPEQTDPLSGIVMKPDPNDNSVRTYNPTDIERAKDVKPVKSKYTSGEPVHDRS